MSTQLSVELPGLDCGVCGYRTCADLAKQLPSHPDLLERCIHRSPDRLNPENKLPQSPQCNPASCGEACCATPASRFAPRDAVDTSIPWVDSLGRNFDFYLEHFPEDPGPREIILPHNPLITRELDIKIGDILIGRPLGMSCGCPITHCGFVTAVEHRTGVITWCVTGPLGPRAQGYKDLGYYIAEAYEGIVHHTRAELRIGMRYYFQPRMCMLQWRHSGLLNSLKKLKDGYEIRVEGLFIG